MWVKIEGNTARLNGTIWSGDGAYVASDLVPFLMQSGDLEIYINTPGGSVFDGFIIYNMIKNSSANVTFIIDGLCASMGTIIMLSGSKIKMLDNSFLMTHAPSGWLDGTADDFERYAKVLRSIEDIFSKYFAKKTGKTIDEAKEFMNGDNWYSATQAIETGLIDEIIESNSSEDIDLNALVGSNIAAVIKAYDDKYPNTRKEPQLPSNNLNKNKMKLTPKVLAALNLSEGASEADINAAIERVLASKLESDTALATMKGAKVGELIRSALQSGKITAAQKEKFEKLAKSDFDLAKETIDALQPKENITDELNPEQRGKFGEAPKAKEGWTFMDYVKKDPTALNELKEKSPEEYQKLYNQHKNK